MLTFCDNGNKRPVAIIKGGEHNGRIIYLDETPEEDVSDILDSEDYKMLSLDEKERIIKKVSEKMGEKKRGKKITIKKGEIQQIPNPDKREIIYVSGPSGAGKSTYVGKYGLSYRKIFPENEIYVFSRLNEDQPIDVMEPNRILLDEEFVKDPIDLHELSNSFCIFDDALSIGTKDLSETVKKLMVELIEYGRKEKIYVAVTTHLLSNKAQTREILNECNSITFFPHAGSFHQISYTLDRYFGIPKKKTKDFMKIKSRWVTVYKTYPQYMIWEKGIMLMSEL